MQAATFTVTNFNDSGPGSLRQAVADASSGDSIQAWIVGSINLEGGEIFINKDLEIHGPAGAGLKISGNGNSRVFRVSAGSRVVITDLTIRNGYADGTNSSAHGDGGGIYNSGNLTLKRVVVRNNFADKGFYGLGGGGGIYNEGTLFIDRSRIINNAMYGETQINGGGGIFSYGADSKLLLSRSLVANNAVQGEYLGGGGVFHAFGEVKIIASIIANNTTDFYGYGGGIYSEGGAMLISGSTINDNSTDWDGGGLYNYSTDITIINSTFSGNSAATGGGIYHGEFFAPSNTKVRILHTTIIDNSASQTGGFHYTSSGPFRFERNLVAANFGISPDCSGDIPSSGYNLIGDNSGCNLITNGTDIVGNSGSPVLAQVGLLANNGGRTETHALLANSPALDRIPRADCNYGAQPLATDQRGYARPVSENCDIGAFELQDN